MIEFMDTEFEDDVHQRGNMTVIQGTIDTIAEDIRLGIYGEDVRWQAEVERLPFYSPETGELQSAVWRM